ncbi:MAG: hypothetical protein JST39_00190, partial [Bacteroidetes bacterium]|nr:hypothetical protein [Bacteroidota bacterium]
NPTQVARLNKDGSLDQSFSPITITNGSINALCVDKNDNIYLAGTFQQFGGSGYSYLVRLNKDGSIDNSFQKLDGTQTGINIKCLALRADGKLVAGGQFGYTSANGLYYKNIMRLNADGSIDNSFYNTETQNPNYFTSIYVSSIDVLANNKIYVAGSQLRAPAQGSLPSTYDLVRINDDGSLDRSFSKTGNFWVMSDMGRGAGSMPDVIAKGLNDGTVLLAGYFDLLDSKAVKNPLQFSSQGSMANPEFSGVQTMVSGICQFSNDELLIITRNPPTPLFGDPSPRLWIKGADGQDRGSMKDNLLSGDMNCIVKESDSTALIAGKMVAWYKTNGVLGTVAFVRVKKRN